MLTRYSLFAGVLAVALVLLISGCFSPETSPPTPSIEPKLEVENSPAASPETPVTEPAELPTAEPTQTLGQAPDSLATPTALLTQESVDPPSNPGQTTLETPVITDLQEMRFINTVAGLFTSAVAVDPSVYDLLAGPYLVAITLESGFIDILKTTSNKFGEKVQPFLEYAEGLDAETKIHLAQQAIQDYGLYEGAPPQIEISYTQMTTTYDAATVKTTLVIPVISPLDLTLAPDAKGRILINARSINPLTLEEEVVQIPVEAVELVAEDSIVFGKVNKLTLTIPGNLLRWSSITLEPGALVDATEGDMAALLFYTRGLSGTDAAVALRPWAPGEQGRNLLTPNTYGAPEPQLLPAIPEADLEQAMRGHLASNLALAVEHGNLSRKRLMPCYPNMMTRNL